MKIKHVGDLVFEVISNDLYVMVANRYNKIDTKVYSGKDLDDLKAMGYRVEIQHND